MWCALVFYFVATIFVVVYSGPELCDYEEYLALCGKRHVKYTFDFIPPVFQNISYINLRGQPLKQLPYNAFRNLSSQRSISVIWITFCQISYVDAGALLNLDSLSRIYLSSNDITQIDSKLFSHTTQIKYIGMGHNKIEVIPSGLFQNLTLLESVYLSQNRISQVEWFSFKNTPSLQFISLDNNQIESMNMLFKDKFDNLTTLFLRGNPWKCDCELGPLHEFLINYNHLNQPELLCTKPRTLQGRKWSDIRRDVFVCNSEDAISTQHSAMASIEPVPIVTQQPPSDQNWILYTIIIPIIGVVLFVRYALLKLSKRRYVLLPTIAKRSSFRQTNGQMDSGLPMRVVHSSAVSEDCDSASNTGDVVEEQTSIHHYEIRVATIH